MSNAYPATKAEKKTLTFHHIMPEIRLDELPDRMVQKVWREKKNKI
jgi:hypothetical protein